MSTFQPDSLHPYIMDERLKKATGSGGISNIPIASAETLGGIKVPADSGITITGSGNAYAYKPINYSTNEVNTGRKWIDGSDIYERVVDVNVELEQVSTIIADASYIDDIISCIAIASTTHAYTPILCYMDNGALKGKAMAGFTASEIIIKYTKPTTP